MGNLKRKAYSLVEPVSYEDPTKTSIDWFDKLIIALIFLNVIAVILSTVERIERIYSKPLYYFEVFSIAVFTIEYLLRLWSCTENPKYKDPIRGRIKLILSPLALVDLLSILPFYLPMLIAVDLRFLRAIRLIRIFRLFKMGRYSESLRTIGNVFRKKRGELLVTLFIIFILLIVSASMLYYAERDAQPDKFSSIPASMWWSVVTLTTVGYGDVFPVTSLGKFFGSIISFLGIGLFALPTGILGAGFLEELKSKKSTHIVCPHCGGKIETD